MSFVFVEPIINKPTMYIRAHALKKGGLKGKQERDTILELAKARCLGN